MGDQMTRELLLQTLRDRRAEWDALVAQVPAERMTEPGLAGGWSLKDVIAHLTYYERWFGDRLDELLRGEPYVPSELDFMGEARNDVLYERERARPLEQVLADARQVFQRLLAGVEAQPEAVLIEPQQFQGAPGPVVIWQMLRGDVYDHYAMHIPAVRAWLKTSS
jgi:uncharacterized protein (TIGR03083 family)